MDKEVFVINKFFIEYDQFLIVLFIVITQSHKHFLKFFLNKNDKFIPTHYFKNKKLFQRNNCMVPQPGQFTPWCPLDIFRRFFVKNQFKC